VDCDDENQIARVTARSQLSRNEVMTIMAQQTPRAARLARADDIISNNAHIDDLEMQVTDLHKRYSDMGRKNIN